MPKDLLADLAPASGTDLFAIQDKEETTPKRSVYLADRDMTVDHPINMSTDQVNESLQNEVYKTPRFNFYDAISPVALGQRAGEAIYGETQRFGAKVVTEPAKALARGVTAIPIGASRVMSWLGDNLASEEEVSYKNPLTGQIENIKRDPSIIAKSIGKSLQDWGNNSIKFYETMQKDSAIAPDKEIFSGSFTKNPSWTRGAALIAEGLPITATAAAITFATKNPAAGANAIGLFEGSQSYAEAREKGQSISKSNVIGLIGTIVSARLEQLPLEKYLEGKGAIVGAAYEGGQEVAQTWAQNAIAILGYDKTRDLFQGTVESLIAGAATGGMLGALTAGRAEQIDNLNEEFENKGGPYVDIEAMRNDAVDLILANKEEINALMEKDIRAFQDQQIELEIPEDFEQVELEESLTDEQKEAPSEATAEESTQAEPSEIAEASDDADISFEFGEEEQQVLQRISETDEFKDKVDRIRELSAVVDSFNQKKESAKRMKDFKIRKFKKGFMSEELQGIPKQYFVKEEFDAFGKLKGMALDEVADKLGVSFDEALRMFQQAGITRKDIKEAKAAREELEQLGKELEAGSPEVKKAVEQITKKSPKLKLKQSQVIRRLFQEFFRGQKAGFKEGKEFEKQKLTKLFREKVRQSMLDRKTEKQNVKDLKRGLIETIKQHIPPAQQNRFLSFIANAETGTDILKGVAKIERVAEEVHRKQLVTAIKKTLSKIQESKSIAIDYIQKIRDLVDGLDFTRRQSDTILKIMEMQRAIGDKDNLSKQLLDKIEILGLKPLDEISTATLENVLNDMATLVDAGKKKLETFKEIENLKKQNALTELKANSKKISEKDIILAKPGEKLTRDQVMKNKAAQAMNWAMRLDLSITPMDVVFDSLDGVAGYQGSNFRIFKKTIDDAYSKYIQKKQAVAEDIISLSEELKLEDTDFEKIGFYAAAQQEGGAEKLQSLGFTKKEIEGIKLSENQTKLYEAMRSKLDGLRPEIAEVMRVVYNEELGEVKNYFPFMTDFEAMSDSEIRERFGNNVQQFGQAPKKNVEQGFTKKRVGGKQKIKLNAMQIFLGHIDNSTYLITVGKETKRLGEIAATQEYAGSVGELGQEIVRDWIDIVARKGKANGQRDNVLDTMRRHTGVAVLGFKLSSAIIQPTALLDGASLIGGKAFEGASLITKKEWRQFIMNNMPEIKERIGDDVAFTEFGSKSIGDKVANAGFWALKNLDALTASSVAAGAYTKYLEDNKIELDLSNPNAEAISYAQKIVRRTQASSFFKDAPSALTRGTITGSKSIDKLLLQFQTFMLNRWSLIKHDMYAAGIKGENKAQALNIAFWLTTAAFAETGLRRVSKELINSITGSDDEEEDGFVEQVVRSLLSNIPFVSSVISFSQYGSMPIPAVAMMKKLGDIASALSKSKKENTIAKNRARFAISFIGWIFGIPGTVQADQIANKILQEKKKSLI